MELILAEVRKKILSKEFAAELAAVTDISLEKSPEILELSLSCLLLGISKQLTNTIGKQVIFHKLLRTPVPLEDIEPQYVAGSIRTIAFCGDKLLGSMLPGQKSLFVKVITSHVRIRAEAASIMANVVIYLLVQRIQKEAFGGRWSEYELKENLQNLAMQSDLSALTDQDIRVMGLTSFLRKA